MLSTELEDNYTFKLYTHEYAIYISYIYRIYAVYTKYILRIYTVYISYIYRSKNNHDAIAT